jgi:hypothetical protein
MILGSEKKGEDWTRKNGLKGPRWEGGWDEKVRPWLRGNLTNINKEPSARGSLSTGGVSHPAAELFPVGNSHSFCRYLTVCCHPCIHHVMRMFQRPVPCLGSSRQASDCGCRFACPAQAARPRAQRLRMVCAFVMGIVKRSNSVVVVGGGGWAGAEYLSATVLE